VLTLLQAQQEWKAFSKFETRAYQGFDTVISPIPFGSKVAGLIFERGSGETRFSPLLHAVNWIQVERGGLVMFTFAEFPQSPFTYRKAHRPPKVPRRWEWTPERVNVDKDLAYYDFVIVSGTTKTIANSRLFAQAAHDGKWSLWGKKNPL
jgi:hypothetical protein